ncbi:MAG: DUF2115 family protein [Methanocorpusculum sp.]|nr:DUF2115 family protein [Methanocorpusculum sp.]
MSFWNRGVEQELKFSFDGFEKVGKKGFLLEMLKDAGKKFTPDDLDEMIYRYSKKLDGVPCDYAESLISSAKIQIIDGYHKMMTCELDEVHANVKLNSSWKKFVKYAVSVTSAGDESSRLRSLKLLIAAFTVYILEEPVHPVGMIFPGGYRVEIFDGVYYCPVRAVWNEVDDALCRFCPAVQSRERDLVLSRKEREFVAKEEKLENYFYNFKG